MTGPTAAGVAQEIATLAEALAEARRQAGDGASIDLAGLVERVAALCALVEALPRADTRPLLGTLGELVAALDPLTAALTTQHSLRGDAVAAAIEGRNDPHTARQRASAAYGRGPFPSTTPPDEPT